MKNTTASILLALALALAPHTSAAILAGDTGEITSISGPSVDFSSWAGGTADFDKLIDGGLANTASTATNVNWTQASTTAPTDSLPHQLTFTLDGSYNISATNIWNDFGTVGHGIDQVSLDFLSSGSSVGSTTINVANQTDVTAQTFATVFNNVDQITFTIDSVHGTLATDSGGGTDSYQIQEVNFTGEAVPEPTTGILAILGGMTFLFRRSRYS